jgi:hypothetical protein
VWVLGACVLEPCGLPDTDGGADWSELVILPLAVMGRLFLVAVVLAVVLGMAQAFLPASPVLQARRTALTHGQAPSGTIIA